MATAPLTKDSEFLVGEETWLNYLLAILFFGMFVFGMIDAVSNNFGGTNYWSYLCIVLLIPAIFSFKRARSQRIHIRINKNGIYQNEQLITGWTNFLKAYITQEENPPLSKRLQDNFLLVVEYMKDNSNKGFRRKIPLTNTQDKSEEDVLAAVKFFWKEFSTNAGITVGHKR